jgi:hypothetical protein
MATDLGLGEVSAEEAIAAGTGARNDGFEAEDCIVGGADRREELEVEARKARGGGGIMGGGGGVDESSTWYSFSKILLSLRWSGVT